MIVSFDRLPEQLVPGFKGGDGVVSVRAYDDEMGRILQLTVPVGGSIGPHTHTDNCEVMCIVSGTGLCHDDGTEVTLTPGMWHYNGDLDEIRRKCSGNFGTIGEIPEKT